jgi:hypothetical protein
MHTDKEIAQHYKEQQEADLHVAQEYMTCDDIQDNIWILSDFVYDLTMDYIDFTKVNMQNSGIRRTLIKEELKKKIFNRIDDLFDFNKEEWERNYENE